MYKFILIVFALFFVNLSSQAQDENYIYGKVVNTDTNAVVDATVYWDTKNKKNKTRTEPDGTFRIVNFKEEGRDIKLVIEAGGKIKQELSIKNAVHDEFIHVMMQDKGVTSITASRWEQSIYEVPASTIVISRDEIEQNGYLTVQEILENVPGLFTIDQRYASGATIGIRGFWTDFSRNVMIQLNGINMLNDRRNDFPLDKINVAVESIDKIEIVRGPMSVIYGDGAFFGVINIITNGSQESSSSSFTSGYGTQNTIKQTLRYALNKDGLNLSLNAMVFHRDGFDEAWEDLISPELAASDSSKYNAGFKFPNAVTLSDYYYNKDQPNVNPERYSKKYKSFNMSMSYNGFFSNINYSNSNSGFSYKAVGPGQRNDYTTRNSHYQFGYRNEIKEIGNGLEWQLKTEYMTSRGNQISSRYVDSMLIVGEDRISSVRTEFNTRYSFLEDGNKYKLDLISGLYYNYNFENGTFYNAPDINLRNWWVGLDPEEGRLTTTAGYAQLESKIKNWQIIGGIRISQQGSYKMLNEENVGYYGNSLYGADLGWSNDSSIIKFQRQNETKPASDVQFIPRFAAIYHFEKENNKHFFKAMYGKAVNEINVVQNAYDIMRKNANLSKDDSIATNSKGYSYLAPEEIQTIEFGHTLVNEKNGFELNTNVFINVLSELITRQTSQINGVYVTSSVNDNDQNLTRGIEFIGKKKFDLSKRNKLTIQGSLTLQSTKSLDTSSTYKDYFNDFNYTNQEEYNASISDNDTNNISSYDNDLYPTSFSPPVLANFNVTSYFGLKHKAYLVVNFGGNYVGPMWGQAKQTFVELADKSLQEIPSYYGNTHALEVPGYWRFSLNVRVGNLHLNKKLKASNSGYFVSLKVSNLFDTSYRYPNHSYTVYFDKGVLGRQRQIIGNIGYKF
tara:strand:- start:269 stop:2974 length:2706 start_codon:yes stop_codon:yes gene_type:complete